MLDIKFIRENPDVVKDSVKRRGLKLDIDDLLIKDRDHRANLQQLELLKAKQNEGSRKIAAAQGEEKQKLLEEMKELAVDIDRRRPILKRAGQELQQLLLTVPNLIADEIHDGKGEEDNEEIKTVGEPPKFDFETKDHIELGEALGIIDIERGVKIAGTRGYVLVGDGARLESALLRYGQDFIQKRGFTQLNPPYMGSREMFVGSGHFPGSEDETFILKDKEKEQYLIGTGEVPLVGYHAGETLDAEELPKTYAAMTPSFRTEVGSYGKDTHGLYRVRQFHKVEQVVLCKADKDESKKWFDTILKNATDFMESLDLPYRLLRYCAGDMFTKGYRAYDIEAWMPSRNAYGETHTCSEILDYQTRRHRIMYKEDGKKHFAYALNNTVVATPRILIPILELNQQKDGSIKIPKVLQPYMDGQKVIKAS